MDIPNNRVLYISYDGMTDPLGQSQVIPYLSGLAEAGYEITLLSFEKKERFEKNREFISGILTRSRITWVPLFYTKKPPVLSTVWDVTRLISKASELHKEKPFALVHCRSYISALAGLALKRRFGIKFIFDMRGFWADERIDGKIWNPANPVYNLIYRFFKSKEKQFLQEADYTISLTECGRDEIHSWPGLKGNPVPIQVIPCCADLSLFDYHTISPDQTREMRKSLAIGENDFVVSYLGSIGTWYMLDEMLGLFKAALERQPGAKFLFITPDEEAMIRAAALRNGLNADRIIIRPAARAEVPLLLSLSRLSVFFIRPTYSKKASSPTKQGEIMGMGIPLICNSSVGDTDRIVAAAGCGTIVTAFTPQDYSRAVAGIDAMLRIEKAHIRAGAETWYSLQNGIKKYLSVYQKVLA